MKFVAKKVLFGLCVSAASIAAYADTPTVTFVGEVTDQTCSAVINGATSSIVMLPTVPSTALANPGDVTGATPFTIQLEGCAQAPVGGTNVKTVFLGHDVTAGKNLGNAGTATNVAIQLLDAASSGSPILLNGPTAVPGLVIAAGQTEASYQFAAQYISEAGGATAGSVQAVAEYTVSYL